MADLIFVFFDPIGQALCKRTLNIVEKLNEKHSDHMRFYLSKADEAGHESDRQVRGQAIVCLLYDINVISWGQMSVKGYNVSYSWESSSAAHNAVELYMYLISKPSILFHN